MSPYRVPPRAPTLPPHRGLAARLRAAWTRWRYRRALAAWFRASAAVDAPFWEWRRTGDSKHRKRYLAALDAEERARRAWRAADVRAGR